MKDWDDLYKKRGEVHIKANAFIEKAAGILNEKKARRVLDLGCGTGRHTVLLASKGFDVYGVDISETGLDITRKKLKESGLNARIELGDMHSLRFDDGFFDAVISTYVITHSMKNGIEGILGEIARVLKREGLLVLAVLSDRDGWYGKGKKLEENTYLPTFFPDEADIPHHFFTEKELRRDLAKFKILELHHLTSWSRFRKVKWGAIEVICQKDGAVV